MIQLQTKFKHIVKEGEQRKGKQGDSSAHALKTWMSKNDDHIPFDNSQWSRLRMLKSTIPVIQYIILYHTFKK